MIPVSDIEVIIKMLSGKLPKIKNGQNPSTYITGRDEGERSAYSYAIRLLRTAVKKHKKQDIDSVIDEIKAIDNNNPFLKEYREKIDKANKQYFNSNRLLK